MTIVVASPPVAAQAPTGPSGYTPAATAQNTKFGSDPLADVLMAAQQNNRCTSLLSTDRLAAMVLSVTWPELTDGATSLTPSPMTLSRADTAVGLFYQGLKDGPYRRAFWHPGIGVWQMDDFGIGKNLTSGKFNTAESSAVAADEISRRFCNTGGNFRAAVSFWNACTKVAAPGPCEQIYAQLFVNGSLKRPDADTTTTRMGGVQARTCRRQNSTTTFPCFYVNPSNAQGHTGSWVYSVDGVQPQLSPLSLPFYLRTEVIGSTTYEWRHWLAADVPVGTSGSRVFDIAARRPVGVDSRTSLFWATDGLCDTTAQRGSCGTTTLTVSKTGSSTGTINSVPSGISCGSDCTESYTSGPPVKLTATAASGSTFSSWSGCDSTSSNTCTVTMSVNKAVAATFTSQTYSLQVSRSGNGSVGSSPSGISCGGDCSESYTSGTQVTLTATVQPGATLSSWSGCDSTSTNTCKVAMNANRSVTATFGATQPKERIANGSFSSGKTSWTLSGDFWSGTSLSNYRTSPGYAAGGVDSSGQPKNSASGSMYQSFSIPANATTASLTLWLNVTSEDTGTVSNDKLSVDLQNSAGSTITSICTRTNRDRTSSATSYASCSLNLLSYKGQTLRVKFTATTNGSLKTTFRVDDVSVSANGD